jgi:hypothetical protein
MRSLFFRYDSRAKGTLEHSDLGLREIADFEQRDVI